MNKGIVFTVALGCFIYAEPGSGLFFQSFVLPIVLIISLVYLLGFSASIIVTAGGLSLYFSDLGSDSTFTGVILPLSFVFWLLVLIYWAWKTGHLKGSGGGDGGRSIGGDGGGCDGGGGGGGE